MLSQTAPGDDMGTYEGHFWLPAGSLDKKPTLLQWIVGLGVKRGHLGCVMHADHSASAPGNIWFTDGPVVLQQ